ncbi:MAG: hypothetical protein AVDCRST_MAG41-1214, partial [uncultured Corynebacteriales bacterium]
GAYGLLCLGRSAGSDGPNCGGDAVLGQGLWVITQASGL